MAAERRGFLSRQLATLAIAQVRTGSPMAPVRAASWHNTLLRLGVRVPLFAVHDLGVLLAMARQETHVLTVPPGGAADSERAAVLGWRELVAEIARSEAIERSAA